ncbi:hypothetical protein [Rhodoblastus sp.]|uniref:hypothetical protein n=1 Tax=Rhodoblastus sp. TaxID=1962975 RepID=UPI00260EBAD0|nr:hypothetical protein [Rhodoblastus sp.]
MPKALAMYWARLEDNVHPDDKETFRQVSNHGFNLDFPPPAFIGDIVNAPVIILDNNGGYNAHITPAEFPDQEARNEFRKTLHTPQPVNPLARSMSRYYLERNYSRWLISGQAALVNGVAYRSLSGRERAVEQLTRILPSAIFHQKWLRDGLAPLAERRDRFVVVHRWGRWNRAANALRGKTATIFSTAPVRPDLTLAEFVAVQTFLGSR